MASEYDSKTNLNQYPLGSKVKLLIDDLDNDEFGRERPIPAGTIGAIANVE